MSDFHFKHSFAILKGWVFVQIVAQHEIKLCCEHICFHCALTIVTVHQAAPHNKHTFINLKVKRGGIHIKQSNSCKRLHLAGHCWKYLNTCIGRQALKIWRDLTKTRQLWLSACNCYCLWYPRVLTFFFPPHSFCFPCYHQSFFPPLRSQTAV